MNFKHTAVLHETPLIYEQHLHVLILIYDVVDRYNPGIIFMLILTQLLFDKDITHPPLLPLPTKN